MESIASPVVVIGGTNSGCGKTTITCAILQILSNRDELVGSFKCGPDYIDPMFHSKVIGVPSRNLDSFFCDDETLKAFFCKNSELFDISIVEGVMGFYDGMTLNSEEGSTYEVAKKINAPVILTINCKGMANSTLAILKGFKELKKDSNIVGVIFNNMTKNTYESIKPKVLQMFNGEVKPLGHLPKLPNECIFESRHLGLVTAGEIENFKERLNKLATFAEQTLDIDGILEISKSQKRLKSKPVYNEMFYTKIRIAIAKDKAFCFYYKDNLELLQKFGAELVYFSPLDDEKLPPNIQGMYLGGGYPELYLEKLSQNKSMLKSIKKALQKNIPTIAECGGFMYLNNSIEGYSMVGFLNGECTNLKKLTRFGYAELTANSDNLLCKKGEKIKGHEFHYYDCNENGEGFTAIKPNGKSWNCVITTDTLYAGYPHLYFYSNKNFIKNFYSKCLPKK